MSENGWAPGYYDDGHGRQRWWDGTAWTEDVLPDGAGAAPAPTPDPAATIAAPVASAPDGSVSVSASWAPAPTAPERPRLTWLWIVLGVVGAFIVLIVVGVILVVNLVLNAVGDPRTAVQRFDQAYDDLDCAALLATVTPAMAEAWELSLADDCGFDADTVMADYDIDIESVEVVNDTAEVITRERWVDVDGSFDERFVYEMVRTDGDWLIDDYYALDGELTPID